MTSSNDPTVDPSLDTLLTFPAVYAVKVMGKNDAPFRALVEAVCRETIPAAKLQKIDEKPSRNGKYLAYTISAEFADKAAIDAVYQALTASPLVLMAL